MAKRIGKNKNQQSDWGYLMPKLDLEVIRQALDNFDRTYVTEYLATSDTAEVVNKPSSPLPLMDENNDPMYGSEFFDLITAHLLLRECDPDKYPISANIAEQATRLGYEGLRHCGIMTDDFCRRRFCNQIAFNELPDSSQVWNYLLWLERYRHPALQMWFYYTLLLWAMLEDKHLCQYGYRSRVILGICMRYSMTETCDYNAERKHDVLHIQNPMLRLVRVCCKHEFPESKWEERIPYLLSSLREFSILTLGTMLSRSCAFEIFRPLGLVTKLRSEQFHQKVVDQFYKSHYKH